MLNVMKKFVDDMCMIYGNDDHYRIYRSMIDEFYNDKNITTINMINFVFYDKFNENPENVDSIKNLCNSRIGQTKFRCDLVNYYKTCIVSGDDNIVCQACHIIPYSDSHVNYVGNGLLLNYNLHCLFDTFLMTFVFEKTHDEIHDLYRVIISKNILEKPTFVNFIKYNNKIVKINKNSKPFLEISYNKYMEQNT